VIDDETLEFTIKTFYDAQDRNDESGYYTDYSVSAYWNGTAINTAPRDKCKERMGSPASASTGTRSTRLG